MQTNSVSVVERNSTNHKQISFSPATLSDQSSLWNL
jgi:hypothetical protein